MVTQKPNNIYLYQQLELFFRADYLADLEETLQLLADNPKLGCGYTSGKTKTDYHYHRYVSHVIYYRQREQDIFVVRILHKKMLPEKHL
jgi:toxin ParE1/3/4